MVYYESFEWTRLSSFSRSFVSRAQELTTGSDGSIYIAGTTNEDLDGQTNSGEYDASISKYNPDGTRDETAPTISSFTYNDRIKGLTSLTQDEEATEVATNSNFALNFSETVDVKNGNIIIYKYSDDSVFETIDVTDGSKVTGTGSTQITINPKSDLEEETKYYVHIAETAFDDFSNNSYAGVSDNVSLSFKTADADGRDAPTISSFTYNDRIKGLTSLTQDEEATEVATNSNFALNFSETVDVKNGNIIIYKYSDDSVFETIDVTDGSKVTGTGSTQITINPKSDLEEETKYYVHIAETAFDDFSNNSYAGVSDNVSLSFKTADADADAPTISSFTYNDRIKGLTSLTQDEEATEVATNSNFALNFSETVDVKNGNIIIYKYSDDSVFETIDVTDGSKVTGTGSTQITINPKSDLEEETKYYVHIAETAFDDFSNNSYAGVSDNVSLSFKTADADADAPTISSFTYNDRIKGLTSLTQDEEATEVATNSNFCAQLFRNC